MNPNTTQKTATLKIERLFNATPAELWSYWTDPVKYAKWLNPAPGRDLVIHEFDVRVGGKARFDMPQPDGNKNPQEGVFHTLDPYKEIVTGDADRSFLLQVLFVPAGKLTRMVINVTGVPDEDHALATVGWNQGFDKLEKLLGGPTPIPKVAGPNVGFTIERNFKAAPERVWKMWTTKEGLEKWWIAGEFKSTVRKLDVRVGGAYDIEATDGIQTIHNRGTYTEVVPNRRLAYTWHFDIFLAPTEEPYDVPISIDLERTPTGTKMTFKEGPLATAEHTEGSRQGVLGNFERLAMVLERER